MEDSRKEFEAWFTERYVSLPRWGEKPALYRRNIKYAAWQGWQAARGER